MLLVGGGDFLVEVVEVGVIFGSQEGEVVSQGAHDGDGAILRAGVDFEQGVVGPGAIGILRGALGAKAGGEMVCDLILFQQGVVDIDGDGALVLSYEGVPGSGLEKEAGEE